MKAINKNQMWTQLLRWSIMGMALTIVVMICGANFGSAQESETPSFGAYYEEDRVEGWGWPLGAYVFLEIDDPGTPEDPDYVPEELSEVTIADWDESQTHVLFELANYDLKIGDEVTLTTDGITKETVVTYIEVTEVDVENNTVSGLSDPGENIWVQYYEYGVVRNAIADPEGKWIANFEGELDLKAWMSGDAARDDVDWDTTIVGVWAPYIRVNQTYDEIDGQTPHPNMDVEITVYDENGDEKGAIADSLDRTNEFWSWCAEDDSGECVDMVAGDTVSVEMISDDMISTLITIPVITMSGEVDAVASTISGQIDVSYEADVLGEVWTNDNIPSIEGDTDINGNYILDFFPDDVKEGDLVVLWYIQPYGHQVGIERSALRVVVDISRDRVFGETTPGNAVNVAVSDVSGPKGSGSDVADVNGSYYTGINNGGCAVNIFPGDLVEVTANGVVSTVDVPEPFTASLDAGTDTVSGKGPSGAEFQVRVYNYKRCKKWVTVESSGDWSVDVSGCGDMKDTDEGDVRFFTTEGHQVRLRFMPPMPPEIGPITAPYDPVRMVNGEAMISASACFTDPNSDDTHNAYWNWGDVATQLVNVTSPVSEDHTYTEPGVYELSLTITDSKGNSDTEVFQFVVVYNPDGGFVTGGAPS